MRTAPWIVAAALAAACAANPRPGEPGYPFNVEGVYDSEFVVAGERYAGTTELSTAPGGAVRGDLSVERPVRIVGDLAGALAGDSLSWSGAYAQMGGCEGTIEGAGVVAEGGSRVEGTLQVDDSCGGALEGAFSFSRTDG